MILTDKQHQQIHFYLLVLFCFFLLPLPRISVFILIALLLNWLAGGYFWYRRKLAFGTWPLLLVSFYLLHLLGMFYTENSAEGWLDLESKLSFLFLPPILFSMQIDRENGKAMILRAFIGGCLIASLFAYGCAIASYWQTGMNGFYYKHLSGFIHAHPTYLAIYLNFSLFLLLEELFRNYPSLSWKDKGIRLLLMGHFLVFIFLLTARMQLLLLVFLLSLSWLWYMARRKKIVVGFGILLIGLIVAGSLSWMIPTTRQRMDIAYQQFHDSSTAPNIRWTIWEVGIELVLHAPLTGAGTGDVQVGLEKMYQSNQISEALESHYNAHNQYLQTTIALGLLGLLLLLANLFIPLVATLRKRQFIYAFFLSLIILSMLTECILEVQMGILFFVFFNSFLAADLKAET